MSANETSTALQDAIRHLEGCASSWVESAPVTEMFGRDIVVWDGVVEVFDLIDHPSARRAYGWSYETDEGKRRFMVVLHKPPVDSPETAVRAAIAADYRADPQ